MWFDQILMGFKWDSVGLYLIEPAVLWVLAINDMETYLPVEISLLVSAGGFENQIWISTYLTLW